jgi:uncharacterized MnhB-related membrane protein
MKFFYDFFKPQFSPFFVVMVMLFISLSNIFNVGFLGAAVIGVVLGLFCSVVEIYVKRKEEGNKNV